MVIDLKTFSSKPGVYLMKDKAGKVLYVGKANNLKKRIQQYYIPGRDSRPQIEILISQIHDIDTIIVSSEKEALLLENTLIKKYTPKYNILLKDDKTFISLKLSKHQWPTLRLVRYKGKPKSDGTYFGPYTGAIAARETLDVIQRIFPLRECSDKELMNRTRPCILYQIKRCIAPCVNKCTQKEYDLEVKRTIQFLRGQDKEVFQNLYKKMQKASDQLEFEKARDIFKTIKKMEDTIEKQRVIKANNKDIDVLNLYRQADEIVITALAFHAGKLISSESHAFKDLFLEDKELIASFIMQHYIAKEILPHEILTPVLVESPKLLSELISDKKTRPAHIYRPIKGDNKALLHLAYENARAYFNKDRDIKKTNEKILLQLQERLKLMNYPERIECFDNSHTGGSSPVSAMVCYIDGIRDKNHTRKFHIRGKSHDIAAMQEVLFRQYQKATEKNDFPDLVIVDGGKAQLNIAKQVFNELNIANVDVIGLAKDRGRHDKGCTLEKIYISDKKDPIILPGHSPLLFFLQRIRDEAHNTVLNFHKTNRSKKIITTKLDNIPGIGPVKRKALLRNFGSLKRIKEADFDDLLTVKGISKKNAEQIIQFAASD